MKKFNDIELSIDDIDLSKRKPNEWANIYNIELIEDIPQSLWSEFEWAYHICNMDYKFKKDSGSKDEYEKAEQMEMRAMLIKTDIFKTADIGEKYMLKNKYIETEMIKSILNF